MTFNRAVKAYRRKITRKKPTEAILGAFIDGSFQIAVPTNPALAYVRRLDQTPTTAKHRNRVDLTLNPAVAANQSIPIALYYDEYGDLAIWGLEPLQAGAVLQADPTKGAGGVKRVLAGSGVTVNNTDPTRPIVAASGSGSGGDGLLYYETGDISVSNSTALTQLLTGSGDGSLDTAANYFSPPRKIIVFDIGGEWGVGATPGNFDIVLLLGGAGLGDIVYSPAALGSGKWRMIGSITCITPGVSGTFYGPVELIIDNGDHVIEHCVGNLSGTADTTGILSLAATMQMSVADVDNFFTNHYHLNTVSVRQ